MFQILPGILMALAAVGLGIYSILLIIAFIILVIDLIKNMKG